MGEEGEGTRGEVYVFCFCIELSHEPGEGPEAGLTTGGPCSVLFLETLCQKHPGNTNSLQKLE